jgi:hypothetical protein
VKLGVDRTTSGGVRLLGGAALALAVTMTSACSVWQALEAQPGTDLAKVTPGASRAQVESTLGEPIKTLKTRDGVVYRTYHFRAPAPGRGDLALANAGLDLVTFGMWEIVRTKSGSLENRPQGGVLAVTYDGSDRVLDVFPDFNTLPALPADGRRPSSSGEAAVSAGAASTPAVSPAPTATGPK